MKKVAAAYELGFSAHMLRYSLVYQDRFNWDQRARDGIGITDCLWRVIDALFVLTPASSTAAYGHAVTRIARRFQRLIAEGPLNYEDVSTKPNEPTTVNRIEQMRIELESLSESALKFRVRLAAWHKVGRLMAACFSDLQDRNKGNLLPALPSLITAVKELSSRFYKLSDILSKMAEVNLDLAWPLPLPFLRELLGEKLDQFYTKPGEVDASVNRTLPRRTSSITKVHQPERTKAGKSADTTDRAPRRSRSKLNSLRPSPARSRDWPTQKAIAEMGQYFESLPSFPDEFGGSQMGFYDSTNPLLELMYRVPRLEQRIWEAIEPEPDEPIEVVFDAHQPYVIYQNKPLPITNNQAHFLEAVLDGDGEWVSSADMCAKEDAVAEKGKRGRRSPLMGANIGREKARLPEALLKHIESAHRKGYRWVE